MLLLPLPPPLLLLLLQALQARMHLRQAPLGSRALLEWALWGHLDHKVT
jgi:hypothetical protein